MVKRNSINSARHSLKVLQERHARPRRIKRAEGRLSARILAEENRKEREAADNASKE